MEIFGFVDNIGTLQAILFAVGLVLLIVEMFIPGFGFAGGTGLVMVSAAILLTASSRLEAFLMFLALLGLVAVVVAVVLRSAAKGRLSKKLLLHTAASSDKGYTTADDTSHLVGRTGVAATYLRPSGTGDFGGERLDVVSEGSFLEKGTPIRIRETHGSRIVVEPLAQPPADTERKD